MNRTLVPALASALALAGCSSPPPISAGSPTPISVVTSLPGVGGTIKQGILDAQYNLDSAVTIGVLPATDPGKACLDSVAGQLNAPGAASFTPRVSDLVSAGSVGYIYLQQLKALTSGDPLTNLPPGCVQLVGQIVIDGVTQLNKVGLGPLVGAGGVSAGILPVLPLGQREPSVPASNPSLDGH